MIDWAKRQFVKFVSKYTIWMGQFHMPWVKRVLSTKEIRAVLTTAKTGDILAVRAGGWLSSLHFGLNGFSHVAYVYGEETILDSTGIGVDIRDMMEVLNTYERVALLRPRFTDEERVNADNRAKEIAAHDKEKPIGYNFSIVSGRGAGDQDQIPETVTCSQLVQDIVNHGKAMMMVCKKRFGFWTVAPLDFYNASSKYDLILEYGKKDE